MLAGAQFDDVCRHMVLSVTLNLFCVMHIGSHSSALFTKGTYTMSNPKDTKPLAAHKVDKKLFVEKRPEGDFAVRKGNSERASAVLPTQAEAIERAKELNPGASPVVERVRNTTGGKPDQWRKA
jgi:hypothetical protein